MSSLIQTLDSKQVGENGTYEYTWAANSNSIEEKIVQINFQLVRSENSKSMLIPNYYLLLTKLKDLYDKKDESVDYKKYILK